MPPKRGSRKAPKAKTGTRTSNRQTSRVAPSQDRHNDMTPPRAHSTTRRQQVTEAEMVEALHGLDLRIPPVTETMDAMRGLGMHHTDNQRSNPGELLQLQAQMQRLDSELGTLRERQSLVQNNLGTVQNNLGTRVTTDVPTPTQGHQPYMSQQMIPEPVVGVPLPSDSDEMSGRIIPSSPAPSEVPTATLMRQDPMPRGVDAIPVFNDRTEDFETWILRLEAVASQYRWTDDQKRGLILSNLREEPATFIYKTLTNRERQDYGLLVKALTGRFTEIESRKVYRLKYRNLRQQPGESEQQLAARTKAIYDRACPGRDEKVRQEDLVSAFLEALQDDDQRRALEYPRVPDTIEEAAIQAVHYREAARRPTYTDEGFGYDRINRIPQNTTSDPYQDSIAFTNRMDTSGHVARRSTEQSRVGHAKVEPQKTLSENQPTATATNSVTDAGEKQVTLTLTELQDLLKSTAQRDHTGTSSNSNTQGRSASAQSQSIRQGAQSSAIRCDNCGKNGHPASRCWGKRSRNRGPRRRDKSEIDCYICQQLGHCWYECPQYKSGSNRGAIEALLGNGSPISATVVRELFSGQHQNSASTSSSGGRGDPISAGTQDLATVPGTSGESQAK